MKIALAIFVAALVATITMGVINFRAQMAVNIAMANLQLADDASTPEQKAIYLRAFLKDMDAANLPTHAAWFYPSERNKIANQEIVTQSLIKRCDDLGTLNKESMGYSQGMTQITGQEFNHVMSVLQNIYSKAFAMRFGWFVFYSSIFATITGLIVLAVGGGLLIYFLAVVFDV